MRQHLAAAVGRTARQPAFANAMTVYAKLRSEDRRLGQKLDCQGGAERRDALSRLAGTGGEERGATVRRASYDNHIVAQAECTCRLVLDHANRLAWGQNSGQQAR